MVVDVLHANKGGESLHERGLPGPLFCLLSIAGNRRAMRDGSGARVVNAGGFLDANYGRMTEGEPADPRARFEIRRQSRKVGAVKENCRLESGPGHLSICQPVNLSN
jgi:hypothetical protein